jgi:ubiquinone/menaquinone biosynthesis C-methylase UbiE
MQLNEAVKLIQHSVIKEKTAYADLGCGDGLFTKALAQLLMPQSAIYAVDKNQTALNNFIVDADIEIKKLNIDFINDELPFKNLSGILMANSLHYVEDKNAFLLKAKASLSPGGYFIIVEYDTDKANHWVPYPVSFSSLPILFEKINFHAVQKLQTHPSRYWRTMYSALIKKGN